VLSDVRRAPEIKWLTEADLEQRVRHLHGDAGATRESALEGQFSLSGAQAKTALYFDSKGKRWGIPQGRTPTTHILKPASNGFEGFAENEHFCLTLARRIGLASANTEWRVIGTVPTLIAERYDRIHRTDGWHRIHQEDGCQALGIHPASKYESDGGPGFPQLMRLMESSDDPSSDRDRLMKTACFVYLIGATDAHAKNYSLLYARGKDKPSIRLAPLYDIASAWPYPRRIPPQKMRLAMRVGRYYKVQEIQPRHFEELARACNYPAETLLETVRVLAEQLPDHAIDLAKQMVGTDATRKIIDQLVDKLGRHCRWTTQRLKTAS
jgi:serine/threonine-protein kinase HipA